MHFHRRLGHLCFDIITKIAKDQTWSVRLADTTRNNCLACSQGKNTKWAQSKKTGTTLPIDVIGIEIWFDFKGLMTYRDRLGIRYQISSIGYRSNHNRLIWPNSRMSLPSNPSTSSWALMRDLLQDSRTAHGQRWWIYGSGRLLQGDRHLTSGEWRQNQACNGKAERMHHTIMNMMHRMVFTSNLLMSFWGDATE